MKHGEDGMEGQSEKPAVSVKFPYWASFSFSLIYVNPHACEKDKIKGSHLRAKLPDLQQNRINYN